MSVIHTSLYLLFLFGFSFHDVFASPTRHLCRPEQRDALLELKNEFEIQKPTCVFRNSDNPKMESWENKTDCCYWDGIKCDAKSGEVIELDLSYSCLYGKFHSNTSLFRLQIFRFLTTLILSNNDLHGQIPFSIGKLYLLTSLDLSFNQFSGQIPSSIKILSHLNFLDISHNQFSGQILSSIGNLSHLTILDISYNQYIGPIPSWIGNLSHLETLFLNRNKFTGEIPDSFASLKNLTRLYVGSNKLSGDFPVSLLNLTKMSSLDISFNQLTGTLPPNISSLSNLELFFANDNDFVGTLPSSLFTIPSLTLLSLSNNNFTTIDLNAILSCSKSLQSLDLSGNHVSAENKSLISDLQYLKLSDCGITEFPKILRTMHSMNTLDISNNKIKGQVPGWLWKLPNLTYLDLSNNTFISFERSTQHGLSSVMEYLLGSRNNFTGKIPPFICAFRSLRTLDLSNNNFNGSIPLCMGNLKSNLSVLNLSQNCLSGGLPENVFESLRLLNVGHNHFSGILPSDYFVNWSKMSSLGIEEDPSNVYYHDSMVLMNKGVALELVRIPKIFTSLDFSENRFEGEIPSSIGLLKELHALNLSNNAFTGHIPSSMWNLTSLESLDVSQNKLSGKISNLEICLASDNDFVGTIHSSLFTIPSLKIIDLSKLLYLNISFNQLTGMLPPNISSLSNLVLFFANDNDFIGTLPSSLFTIPFLVSIYLSNNNFTTIDLNAILSCSKSLQYLDLSGNKIKGQVPGWLWTLPNLDYVNLSNNTFSSFERPTELGLSSVLRYLLGSRNNFMGNIPSFICALGSLSILDLSDNNFNGSIPLCMGNLKSTLTVLNLRQNRLSGGILENVFESLRSLDVGHNQLVGKLPRSLIHSFTLEVLNVESNKINDTFPFWLSPLQNLHVLVLRSNAFHGPIHRASFLQLKIIDISHNHFNGVLPSDYFVKWSKMSSLGTNEDRWNVNYMGGGYYQDSMVLMNKGVELELVRILEIFTALDFSGNRLEGEIPSSIGLLKELHVLNLSNNAFTGHIPSLMGNLTALESLDVSQNKLSGEIPQELGNLSYLAYMNFSYNQLVGLVPGGTQFRRQPCFSFEENSGLFGPALDEVCKDIHTPSLQPFDTPEPEEEDEEMFSWIAAAIGFGPGIALGLTIGYILVSYKPKWFTSPVG